MQEHGPNGVTTRHSATLCPYCGHAQPAGGEQCDSCGGLFEPLSRQATQNAMGAWFVRDEAQPYLPGRSLQTIQRLVARGKITADTVLRGPTTRQFWAYARDTPGVAHLLGQCHICHGPADTDEYMCRSCGAVFVAPSDRQHLGLAPVRLLPGEATPEVVAHSSMNPAREAPRTRMTTPPPPAEPAPAHAVATPAPATNNAPGIAPGIAARRIVRLRAVSVALGALCLALAMTVVVVLAGSWAGARRGTEEPPTAASAAPSTEPRSAPAAPIVPDWSAMRDEAMRRADEGGRDNLEAALATLQRIGREAAPDGRPPTLERDLLDVNQRLDELNLRKFLK